MSSFSNIYSHTDFNRFFHEWIQSGSIPNPSNILDKGQLQEVYRQANSLFVSDSTSIFNISQLFTVPISATIGNLLGESDTTRMCVQNHIRKSVNQTNSDHLATLLGMLSKGQRALSKMDEYLSRNITNNLFILPDNCVKVFIELNFYNRCSSQSTAPVCSNSCGALIRGCYSPYHTALSHQLDTFLDVSQQVLETINGTLKTLFSGKFDLFDNGQLVSLLKVIQAIIIPTFHEHLVYTWLLKQFGLIMMYKY